jgi:hypothetical protein
VGKAALLELIVAEDEGADVLVSVLVEVVGLLNMFCGKRVVCEKTTAGNIASNMAMSLRLRLRDRGDNCTRIGRA